MENQLSKNLVCVLMRSGIEIWVENDRAENLKKVLSEIKESKFINYNGETINTADISGIFSADVMSEHTRRKNGLVKCKYNYWHQRNNPCSCRTEAEHIGMNGVEK